MQVSQVMTRNPACCEPSTSLSEVARLMADHDCGCIPVCDDSNHPIGVITDRDICIEAVARGKNPSQLKASNIMHSPVFWVNADADLQECCKLMEEKRIRRVVVEDRDGSCCGIIAQADIARTAPWEEIGEVVECISQPAH